MTDHTRGVLVGLAAGVVLGATIGTVVLAEAQGLEWGIRNALEDLGDSIRRGQLWNQPVTPYYQLQVPPSMPYRVPC